MLKAKLRRTSVAILLFILSTSNLGMASTSLEKPYEAISKMEKEIPKFGERPWEKNLKQELDLHKYKVQTSCDLSAKKIKKEKERIRKEKEQKKQEEKEIKTLLENQTKTQSDYTNNQNKKIIEEIKGHKWKSIGSKRITFYCPSCNTPAGSYASSSGVKLFDGAAACSWLPLGSIVKVNGKVYKVLDRCGTDALDIFRDTPGGCSCNSAGSYNAEIYLLEK